MLNYETILSSYDDKMTLMQWLKKVEEALNHASATAFRVNKKGNATISFILDFEDGTTLESGDIVLQQGESVNGAYMQNGHLFVTLTNGQIFDVGNLKPVTRFEINASQHLIVYYGDGTNQDLGAIFSGNVNIDGTLNATKVTGNEIVENMNGYSYNGAYDMSPTDSCDVAPIYIGIVKNGNKLTFVWFGKITTKENITSLTNLRLGHFLIPEDVYNKLYPYTIGGVDNVLAQGKVYLYKNILGTPIECNYFIQKLTFSQRISPLIYPKSSVEAQTDYFIRLEQTFLLSDNLAE